MRAVARAVIAILAGAGLAACGSNGAPSDGRVKVVAGFYPLQFVAERVGGDQVRVANLTKPGAEPHDLELTPSQMAGISDAALVLYLKGFQPAVDEAVAQEAADRAFDVASVQPLNDAPAGEEPGKDPHVWLDPVRFATIADQTAEKLASLDAAHAADFRDQAAALRADLETLDEEYAAGLGNCARHEIVTSHAAFGYLAARYELTQVPITGLNPDEDPSPARLQQVATLAKQTGATTIFFETLVSPKLSEAVARQVGAKAEVLDPIEGLEPGRNADYFSVMRANLATLRTALGCT